MVHHRLLTKALALSYTLGLGVAASIEKRATCTVASAGDAGTDDVPAIQAAIKSCGNGGIIVLSAGKTYALRSTLSFAGCVACEMQIEGTLKLSDDLDFWNGVRNAIVISGIKTALIHSVTGTGLIDGNGVPYWTEFAADSSYARPTMLSVEGGSSGITIKSFRMKNPPNVFYSVSGASTNIIFDSLKLDATATATVTPKNTDGFDIGSSKFVTVRNTTVTNQDDCVVLKPGSDFAFVTGVTCSGSHGLSVGSLGSAAGSTDTVTNGWFASSTVINSAKAVGIKLYDGLSTHGIATVSNVTWTDITVQNCDYAAQIQSCYNAGSTSECTSNPSKSTVTGVKFVNFKGATSTKFTPVTANLNCPASGTCNIAMQNWAVTAPGGVAGHVLCSNVDSVLGVTCTGAASG
ncbi:glycoside hydrolase family 28 protein [Mycena floridula]|nr:glycoside hydrolase family 28 protein [Mycena floridula]